MFHPPQPPRSFFGQLLSKQVFARLSKKSRFAILFDVLQMGRLAPPNPPAHICSTDSQARPSSAEQETTCSHKTYQSSSKKRHVLILLDVLQMGCSTPPNPPAYLFGQLLSKQVFARLSKKSRFAILFDVLQMGGPPPANTRSYS